MKRQVTAFWALVVTACFAPRAFPVEFDCIALPLNPQERPPECDVDPDPSGWCDCLSTGLSKNEGGKPATIEQALILIVDQPTIGTYMMTVRDGTLDLAGIVEGDVIGEFLIQIDEATIRVITGNPAAEEFLLRFEMVVTAVGPESVDFEVILIDTNPTSMQILNYDPPDPRDPAHASGLLYRGTVVAYGGGNGFDLSFAYPSELPEGAVSTALEYGDLIAPNFTVPALITFPTTNIFTLPVRQTLELETALTQLGSDPGSPVERIFPAQLPLESPPPPKETFRRSDSDGSGTVDLSDAVGLLSFLFLGGSAPSCPDAADSDNSGSLDLTDAIFTLTWLFLGGDVPPAPGPMTCGEDPKEPADSLGTCTNTNC